MFPSWVDKLPLHSRLLPGKGKSRVLFLTFSATGELPSLLYLPQKVWSLRRQEAWG